jgi:ribulose-bisphosphate carboxylase large chain
VAEVMAGEQSCGTFTRVAGETDELRERARATVVSVEPLEAAEAPSLPNAWLTRRGVPGPWRRARVAISISRSTMSAPICRRWPRSSPAISIDLGEVTGLRLERSTLPPPSPRFPMPAQGMAGTRG